MGNSITKIEREMEEEDKLKLLDEFEIHNQYLDLGTAKGKWYYGMTIKGNEAIITDEKNILRNTLETFNRKEIGYNEIKDLFDYSSYIGDISPRWNKKSVKEYIKGKNVDKLEVVKKIKEKIDFFMDFGESSQSSSVQACWIIGTYCYPLFYWFPHLLLNAPSESGKSKNSYLLMRMSFGGFDLGASAGVTPAQIFRTLEANRGTIVIDEFERRDNSESQILVNQILNASASRDSYVIRAEQINKKWKAWKFPIFCPKIVCNITGINPTSLNRFVVFHLLKTITQKGKRKPQKEKYQEEFEEIRNSCHILIMQYWKEIKEIYETLDINLSNREEDNWLSILAIAKWLGEEYYNEALKFIENYKDLEVDTGDITENLFVVIYENVTDEMEYYTAKIIASWLEDDLKMFKSPSSWVGRKLGQYKFKSIHRGKGNGYILSKKAIKNIIDRYFPNSTNIPSLDSLTSLTTQDSQPSSITETIQNSSENSTEILVDSKPRLKNEGSEVGEPIPKASEVIDFIKNNNNLVSTNILINHFKNEKGVIDILADLSLKGDIFQPKPEYWKVLK